MPVVAATAAVTAPALSGCGGSADEPQRTDPEPTTVVQVAFDADGPGGAPPGSTTLRCPSDTWPRACAALFAALPRAWQPVPEEQACTARYGGPETGRISGIVAGHRVNVFLSRRNGCEIARFDALEPVLRSASPTQNAVAPHRPQSGRGRSVVSAHAAEGDHRE